MTGTGIKHLHPAEEALLRVEDLTVAFPAGPRHKVFAFPRFTFHICISAICISYLYYSLSPGPYEERHIGSQVCGQSCGGISLTL